MFYNTFYKQSKFHPKKSHIRTMSHKELRIHKHFKPISHAIAIWGTIAVMATSLCACKGKASAGQADAARPSITVSIPPLEYFAQAIGGDSIDIVTLLPTGADPETFEPSTSTMRALGASDIITVTGYLPFENSLLKNIKANNRNIKVFALSDSIAPIYGTHTHHDGYAHNKEHADEVDPHIWASVKNAHCIAANMLKALTTAAPDKKDFFARRYKQLVSRLDSLDNAIARKLDTIPSKAFIIWHPALSYFARDYSLQQIALNIENKESSSLRMQHVLDTINARHPSTFLVPAEIESRLTEVVSSATGLTPVKINFMSSDWEQFVTDVANAFAR